MPIQGWSLGALALLFVVGRLAVAFSAHIGPLAALADLAFPLALLGALGREIVVGRNWRNLPMLGVLALLATANALTHLDALGWTNTGQLGLRLGIAVIITLITLVGGRIIPSFTRNWLAKRGAPRLPAPAGRFDMAVMATTIVALMAWVTAPEAAAIAPLCAAAALANIVRLARWRGYATLTEPLVWVLHLGYLWLPVGFGLLALAAAGTGLSTSTALHGLTGGAIATMILAVSTRATLGHTGRELRADGWTVAIYVLITVAAMARVATGFETVPIRPLLAASATAWATSFALFLLVYGRMLVTPREGGAAR